MRLPGTRELSREQRLWNRLERIRASVGWSQVELLDRLQLTASEAKLLRRRGRTPSLVSLEPLVDELGLNLETLLKGRIDYAAVAARCNGDLAFVPERFRKAAFSRKRTSLSILGYVGFFEGWESKSELLQGLQIHEAALADPDEMINIRLVTELCDRLRRRGYSTDQLADVGAFSPHLSANSVFSASVAGLRDPGAVYELIIEGMTGLFDYNCRYEIEELEEDRCVVHSRQNPDAAESLGVRFLGSENTCAYRRGVMEAFPLYAGLPLSRSSEISCVHRGDPACRFEFRFIMPPSWSSMTPLRAGQA